MKLTFLKNVSEKIVNQLSYHFHEPLMSVSIVIFHFRRVFVVLRRQSALTPLKGRLACQISGKSLNN